MFTAEEAALLEEIQRKLPIATQKRDNINLPDWERMNYMLFTSYCYAQLDALREKWSNEANWA